MLAPPSSKTITFENRCRFGSVLTPWEMISSRIHPDTEPLNLISHEIVGGIELTEDMDILWPETKLYALLEKAAGGFEQMLNAYQCDVLRFLSERGFREHRLQHW